MFNSELYSKSVTKSFLELNFIIKNAVTELPLTLTIDRELMLAEMEIIEPNTQKLLSKKKFDLEMPSDFLSFRKEFDKYNLTVE